MSSAGRLGSTDVTPLPCYYAPIRHPLAFDPFPGVTGYRIYLAPRFFSLGRGGLLQLLSMSLSPCRRYHPAGVFHRISQIAMSHAVFTLRLWARPPGFFTFEATSAFTFVTARKLATTLVVVLSIGFRTLVSRRPAIQATGLLTFTPTGLTPAEHASLRWTHNRT
jgi:hypothetical protein